MTINFISSKDFDETCIMRTKSDNTEIIMGVRRKRKELEEKMRRGSNFIFDSVDFLE